MTANDRKFMIFTWGCQMNEDDSDQIANLFTQMGYARTDLQDEADVAVLVTCSVREKPEQKAKSKLGELRLLKEANPKMIIGICGCMAQKEGEALRKGRPYLDFVVGTANIFEIPEIVKQVEGERKLRTALSLPRTGSDSLVIPGRAERTDVALKSFVPVMYGCDNFCSYCVVPYVRGRERSRPMGDIVSEIRDLAGKGRREVTLLGQNVNSYGATLNEKVDFADLLKAVNDIEGIERIRFMTSHPKDLTDKMIETMRDLPKVCEHIHLAVQSGDDEVLHHMNRKYTHTHFRERVAALRAAVPDIAITTDLIAGFPGETEEQFENTMRLVEDCRFDAAYMFAYNVIPNTAAQKMEGHLENAVKNARLNRIIKLQNQITCEINDAQIGQVFEVLVECVSQKNQARVTGLTRQHKTVNFPGDESILGKLALVRATEGHLYGFVGKLVK
ncbi:MAG: tRNA (N6-isopentenyl adenosine(37)-C2)-methylthiotransferase MiaB [Armatimonadetes bacterium]|nr:tRNA (N6-isopentenyl adenosine(37)-C2)-methylthiotransferase MiaB [Armatimonadota bacterium]